jgi:hypothetical protein
MIMANDQSGWNYADLQGRYERAQLLANDCTQDFAGNYFFPSDRSPRGFWTTTRRQVLDYVCDCPDFSFKVDQQLMSPAPSRWVRSDWSTRPDNRILVNRCIHCFAVAIAEQEVDPRFPVNRIYQAKRERFPKTDCGCGCGGSGDCGCPNKELGLPEPRLILGCTTDCYVEPLTPRTQQTPSTTDGIPAYQTFEIPTIEFAETRYRACAGGSVTISLVRSTSLGFNNATVVGLPVDVEFSFEPEFRTSSRQVTLDNLVAGIYPITIGAIASGNYGSELSAQIEIVDCGNDVDCPPQSTVDFSEGICEGSYFVAFRQTGNKNPDGSCEQIKVLQFQEGLDCDPPEDPPRECESLIPRDCSPIPLGEPQCINTGSGDGFNSNAGFNAVVRVQTGGKTIDYLRPDKKECAEECEFAEITVNIPSCPEPPPKPIPAPFCPIPVNRYLGWQTESEYLSSVAINGIGVLDSFACDDGTIYVLTGYTAKCMPPANRYLDSFAGANYQGNEFGEGCCPFDETKPERPACPVKPPEPILKWSCSGGVCSLDENGIYNSQAECEAALIPPPFTGGQCEVQYKLQGYLRRNSSAFGNQTFGYFDNPADSPVPLSANFGSLSIGAGFGGTAFISNGFGGGGVAFYNKAGVEQFSQGDINTSLLEPMTFTVVFLTRSDGLPDNCGDLPSTCP